MRGFIFDYLHFLVILSQPPVISTEKGEARRVEKSCAQALRRTNSSPFHAFPLFKGEGGPHIQGSQKVSKNFLGRGAAGATGKAASKARRQPWRLAGDEMRGYYPCIGKEWNKVKSTLIHRKRSPFPLKKGEGMKREGVVTDTHRARPVRLRGS